MRIAWNVTDKLLSTVFSKFDEKKGVMLEYNIARIQPIDILVQTTCQLQVMCNRKLFRFYLGKEKKSALFNI